MRTLHVRPSVLGIRFIPLLVSLALEREREALLKPLSISLAATSPSLPPSLPPFCTAFAAAAAYNHREGSNRRLAGWLFHLCISQSAVGARPSLPPPSVLDRRSLARSYSRFGNRARVRRPSVRPRSVQPTDFATFRRCTQPSLISDLSSGRKRLTHRLCR